MRKTIWVSQGQKHYAGGTVTETTGKDISGDSIKVALGPPEPPPSLADAVAPDVDTQGGTTAERVVKLLIDDSFTPANSQYLWCWVSDDPEVEPLRLDGPYTIT